MSDFAKFWSVILASVLLIAAPISAQGRAEEPNIEEFAFGRALATNVIQNGYEAFLREADLQTVVMNTLCMHPTLQNLQSAKNQFAALVKSWSRIELVRFGPILADNRADRILFWPDRRGIALRQVQSVLATNDETATSAQTLTQKSVALQGLTALEYVLYGTDADIEILQSAGNFRCRFGHAIAQNLVNVASQVVDDWYASGGIARELAFPSAQQPNYRNEDEVLREFIGMLIHTVELLRDTRLAILVENETRPGSARAAIFRRSELTIEAAQGVIEGLRNLVNLTPIADLVSQNKRWAIASLEFELQNFERTANEIRSLPIEQAVHDPEAEGKLKYLVILTRSIQRLVIDQIAADLGLSAGFSSLDGD